MEVIADRVLLIKKPLHWTSFDVVNKLRYKLGIKKIGHAGTLDPLASGLLIICTGKMTKQIEQYQGMEKEYIGKFILGQTTPSFDLETLTTPVVDFHHLSEPDLRRATVALTGNIQQVPPLHSAIKIDGKRAYSLAREGKDATLKPREVFVEEFTITKIVLPEVSFKVVCSKGTYIRSLARDFGQILGVGAYLSELCRTRIGVFRLEDALTIEEVEK
ncbi:MAG: tRNA pseudouridine(55) synthase TruB [Bacteroidota bacterium]